jgi:hypothetical protein
MTHHPAPTGPPTAHVTPPATLEVRECIRSGVAPGPNRTLTLELVRATAAAAIACRARMRSPAARSHDLLRHVCFFLVAILDPFQ